MFCKEDVDFYFSRLCCFGYYQKIIKRIIISEIYVRTSSVGSKGFSF